MKNVIKVLIGSLVLSAALTACGKKGAGSPAAAGPVAGAAGVCQLNAQGQCVGGVGAYGYVGKNTWEGNIIVTNQPKYLQFLIENGLCRAQQCSAVSGFLTVQVQTVRDTLPNNANFSITPDLGGYYQARSLSTRAQAYVNAAQNGFQLVYNRLSGSGYGNGYANGYGRPAVMPYGANGQPINTAVAPQNTSLQIVLTWADATQTIANVIIVYQNVQFAAGQVQGQFISGGQQFSPRQTGAAPAVVPYRGQQQPQPQQW